ncbi:hypothetical protein Ae201684_018773 [Aphanomyces euteiches]|uniref:Protein kinase domain-containing protein n=1 Tax=Aphanomyces euteiches TaxID=100861 RepID=A0A6G0W4C1_9STRA|nr:hypothetical protein Ae201684_018773 [Aphanomyces euteiches]KAH9132628.1 hypothetical protein AeRB84_021032 [Aphanomyces euteiches]
MESEGSLTFDAADDCDVDDIVDLFKKNTSFDTAIKDRRTQLYEASKDGLLDVVKELLTQGVSPDVVDKFGETPLYVASRDGHLDVVKELLTHGASVDMADKDGRTSLNEASWQGLVDVVKELLAQGASVDLVDKYGETPLYVASRGGHLDVVQELLVHCASFDMPDKDGRTPLYVASQGGHLDVVQELLAQGALIDTANKFRQTPLHEASREGHLDVIQELLAQGASIDMRNTDGQTPLYLASRGGHSDIVKELLNYGALVDMVDKFRQTPLFVASSGGHLDVVKELLTQNAPVNMVDEDGRSPLFVASSDGNLDVVKELLIRGASVDMADKYGETPLCVASRGGHLYVVKVLLERGANVAAADMYGETPLYEASKEGQLDVVKELLAHGASIDTADKFRQTPLYVASWQGQLNIVKELLAQGASINAVDKDGRTPLYIALWKGHLDVVKELLAHGASVDKADKHGQKHLHVASRRGHLDIVKELLAHGASVNMRDKFRQTPLHEASREGHLDVVKELLTQGSSIDKKNEDGQTPLYLASKGGHLDVVKELLRRGASVNIVDQDGRTPLYTASSQGHSSIVKTLVVLGAFVDMADKDGQTSLYVASSKGLWGVAKELLVLGAAKDVPDKTGATSLHAASRNGHCDIVKELLVCGAAMNKRDKIGGRTPLYLASKNGHFKVVELLLLFGASVDIASWDGRTPLHMASEKGHIKAVEKLLSCGAALDRKAWNGSTSLHVALWQGHYPVVKLLMDYGASVNILDMRCQRPLHIASISRRGNIDILNLLLGHDVDIIATDINGDTPLHCASFWGHYEVVKALLDQGTCANIGNKNCYTPLHLASKRRHLEIVKLLLRAGGDVKKKSKDGKTARDLGNMNVKRIFDAFQERKIELNIHSATKLVLKAIDDVSQKTSKFFSIALSIFKFTLDIRLCRINILYTTLILETIVRYIMDMGTSSQVHALLPVMLDIKTVWWNILVQHNPLKMTFGNNQQEIQTTTHEIVNLQNRLVQASKNFAIKINFQVVSDIEDFRIDAPNMMDKMESVEKCLKIILTHSARQSRDRLNGLAIQIKRGFEHYERQVTFRNMLRLKELDIQFEFCLDKISAAFQDIRRSENLPETFCLNNIESWMLSAEDIQYDLSTPLGRGGFATVFKGMYFGQAVAVKRFDQISTDSFDLEKVIEKEIKAWKDVSHEPNILTLVGVCTKTQTPILVSELCETNIRRYVRDWPEELLPMVNQFARGLAFLHSKNIIHRDLKGDNVLVTFGKAVAIADFGLSRSAESLKNTRTGNKVSGTLNWMSPEQFFSPRSMTTKSDIWSFGMTVWEILCNDVPYRNCSEYEFQEIFKSDDDRPEKPEGLNPCFEPLWTLITKCWQLDPDARPSANDIVEFLDEMSDRQDTPYEEIYFSNPIIDSDIAERDEMDNTIMSFDQLIQLILAEPSREWPLFNNYVLLPKVIESMKKGIFRVRNKSQPWKHLVVKLSENSNEMDFYKDPSYDTAKKYVVEFVESGEWYVRGDKWFALILQRGGENCTSHFRYLSEDNTAKHRFIEQLVVATLFLHTHGWIHGEIKLENVVYFRSEERFKLVNMDHAQKIDGTISKHCSADICSPEMAMYILGHKKILVASTKFDIWCVAVLILKMFLKDGVLEEFAGLDDDAILQLLASPDFNFQQSLNASDLTPAQKKHLASCLHPDPQKRGTLHDLLAILPERSRLSSNPSRSVPFAWRLDGAIEPLPRGKKLRKMSLRLTSLCEMRKSSSRCEHFDQDASIIVEAISTFVRDALPFLKTSSLVIKAIGLISCYDIPFGPDYNFEMSGGIDVENLIAAMENIHDRASMAAPPRMVNIVNQLENGNLEEHEVYVIANELKCLIEEYRKNDAEVMMTALRTLGLRLNGDVIGGLTERTVKSHLQFGGCARWVCRKHAEEYDDLFC